MLHSYCSRQVSDSVRCSGKRSAAAACVVATGTANRTKQQRASTLWAIFGLTYGQFGHVFALLGLRTVRWTLKGTASFMSLYHREKYVRGSASRMIHTPEAVAVYCSCTKPIGSSRAPSGSGLHFVTIHAVIAMETGIHGIMFSWNLQRPLVPESGSHVFSGLLPHPIILMFRQTS